MPELPEVEALRSYLKSSLIIGRTIIALRLDWPKAVIEPDIASFQQGIQGRRIEAIQRRAKFLLIHLDGSTLVVHLRMTGNLVIEKADTPPTPMVRNTFVLDDRRELRFEDPRKLGLLWLLDDPKPLLERLGPEPLAPDFTVDMLQTQLKRSTPIKTLLLRQDVLAGLGNIYADEVLWSAQINPLRPAQTLTPAEVSQLYSSLQSTLIQAVAHRQMLVSVGEGSCNYPKKTWGHLVPRRKLGVCLRCANFITKESVQGRSSYFCPVCQPRSRH